MMNNPTRRYLKHFGAAMLGYTGALFAASWVIDSMGITGWSAGAVSLAPLVPIFYVLESMLWGTGIVGFVSFGYGFLEGSIDAPVISMIWVLPALIGTYGIASVILPLRFK